jgi:hypothetical protein
VQESLHLDLKRDAYLHTDQGRKKAAQDMAAMSIYGGSILLGVEENSDTGLAERVTPVPLAGLPEWISQIATMRIRPPLHVQTRVLNDPDDASRGVVIIDVPVSPVAPHQIDGSYFGRSGRCNTRLEDAEVERLIRQREDRTNRIREILAATAEAVRPRMQPDSTPRVGWLTVVVEPVPIRDPFLLRAQLADNATYPTWLEKHIEAATDSMRQQLQTNPDLAREVPGNWSPQRGHWTHRRTATGVERSCTGTAHTDTPLAGILAVDETGGIRLSYNYLVYGPAGGESRKILCWQDLISAALWTFAFAANISAEAGSPTTLAAGVHVEGINDMYPGEPNDGTDGVRRLMRSRARDPIPTDIYDAVTQLSVAELTGDLRDAVDGLFGQLVRVMGLGDLLARP